MPFLLSIFSKDDPFSGSTTTHSDDPSPVPSPVKTSDNFVKITDELAPLNSLPPGNDDSTLKKDLHEDNFQENVEIKNSNVSYSYALMKFQLPHGKIFHKIQLSIFFPCPPIPVEDSEPPKKRLIISLFQDNLIPPGVERC
ncbi:hypothetical protein Tco_0629088 [Tanacetum coccineum]|uniref:Uncharacterized protein n=1 Tax=Tanacetum coccineum TaxID=301880 RepID=A0ABQ4WSW9_9ASTR